MEKKVREGVGGGGEHGEEKAYSLRIRQNKQTEKRLHNETTKKKKTECRRSTNQKKKKWKMQQTKKHRALFLFFLFFVLDVSTWKAIITSVFFLLLNTFIDKEMA
jgi:hypothetical protein